MVPTADHETLRGSARRRSTATGNPGDQQPLPLAKNVGYIARVLKSRTTRYHESGDRREPALEDTRERTCPWMFGDALWTSDTERISGLTAPGQMCERSALPGRSDCTHAPAQIGSYARSVSTLLSS
jgi:hypothetical protein